MNIIMSQRPPPRAGKVTKPATKRAKRANKRNPATAILLAMLDQLRKINAHLSRSRGVTFPDS